MVLQLTNPLDHPGDSNVVVDEAGKSGIPYIPLGNQTRHMPWRSLPTFDHMDNI